MRRGLALVVVVLLAACAAPPEAAAPGPSTTSSALSTPASGVGTLSPAFREYGIGRYRSGGGVCTPSGALHYVESLEYVGAPPVVLGVDGVGCVAEVRTGVGTGVFAHAVALATQRLGPPDGEDRATCDATGAPLQCLYWDRPEGRFEVVRVGTPGQPEYVLRPAGAPLSYPRLCEGPVSR